MSIRAELAESKSHNHILSVGDQMGPTLERMSIPSTVDHVTQFRDLDFINFTDYCNRANLVNGEGAQLESEIRAALNLRDDNLLSIAGLKRGDFESIGVLDTHGVQYIISLPNRNIGPSFQARQIAFRQSQTALALSHSRLPGFVSRPFVYHDQSHQYAVLECVRDGYEELNINSARANDPLNKQFGVVEPIIQFYTDDTVFNYVNTRLAKLAEPEKQLVMSYAVAKVVAAKTLMALTTLNEENGPLIALAPKKSYVSAGDFVGRFNHNHQLELRPITYRGGTQPISDFNNLVEYIYNDHDATFHIDSHTYHREIPFIPNFAEAEDWVKHIADWTARVLFDYAFMTKDLELCRQIKRFMSPDWKFTLSSIESPYSEKGLRAVSQHFGIEWFGQRDHRQIRVIDPRFTLGDSPPTME